MSTREDQAETDPESMSSTFTVVSDPPVTITPTHQTLEPPLNCTLIPPLLLLEGGAWVGAVGVVVGVVVGLEVGEVGGTVEDEPVEGAEDDPEEEEEDPDPV